MGTLLRDLRYGARALWQAPGFTLVAVLALAVGIGATTAIYTVVDAVMLRPLPFAEPDQLLAVTSLLRERKAAASYPDFVDLRDRNHTLTALAAFTQTQVVLSGGGDPRQVLGLQATPEIFAVLRPAMSAGRGFTAEESRVGSNVVVISDALWRERFGADPNAVGKTIPVFGVPHTVLGVLPRGWHFPLNQPAPLEIILPYPHVAHDAEQVKNRGSHGLLLVGRMKAGVNAGQARADFDSVLAAMKHDHPGEDGDDTLTLQVEPLRDLALAQSRPALIMWLAAVLCVLLIACANVAGLLLARATVRQREIAIRVALGAGRWRIARQMLTESVLLGVIGGAVGVLLALWLVDVLVALVARSLPQVHAISVDGRVLGVTFGLAILTGIIFGLVPALHASRADLNDALKESARSTAHGSTRRARNALIVGEIAGALLLLVGAGLTMRSFAELNHANLGFHPENLTVAQLGLPESRYPDEASNERYRRQLEERLAALPGVQAFAIGAPLPFSTGSMTVGVSDVSGKTNAAVPSAIYASVAPSYFDTLGIRFLGGRTFNAGEDTMKGPHALVISKSFAERMFPGSDAVGKHLDVGICAGECDNVHNPEYEVIGVVDDIHPRAVDTPLAPMMYTALGHVPLGFIGVAVRSANAEALEPALRSAILAVDKELPPPSVGTMEAGIADTLQPNKVLMVLLSLFAGVALFLAVIGIYGVMSYTVTQRTREIGIRVALGAGSGEILALVLGESLRLSLSAVVLGVGAALLGGRALESQLYGVKANDPLTIVIVALIILVVCIVASLLPARRASKVDPMVALRYE